MCKYLEDQFLNALNQNIGIVHRVCNSYFSNKEERADLFQEILYQLWKSYPHFQREARFSTWMYKVSLNTAITYKKKSKRAPAREILTNNLNEIADQKNEQLQTEERARLLYQAIYTLTDLDKAIILLYLEDNSYEDISSVTGLTKTNVSVRLVRIKRVLEKRLKKHSIN